MPGNKPPSARDLRRIRVLDAAEHLLHAGGRSDFSMRDLAEAAGVSFATPFNYFGSKTAIMLALSARRIDAMAARFAAAPPAPDAIAGVLAAFAIAAAVLLDAPSVSRHVIGALGSPTAEPGAVADHSRALWATALGDLAGLRPELHEVARARLPDYLALGFRGCLSFWVAGEITDAALPARARAIAAALLLGFATPDHTAALASILASDGTPA